MKQEDKDLLIKDLCSRLSYGVKISVNNNIETLDGINELDNVVEYGSFLSCDIEEAKPYLYPLSNLTEEQRNEISKMLIDKRNEFSPYGKINMFGCDNLFISAVKQANALINYCITNRFDINGLIERGLAIDATNTNIYDND